MFRLCGLALFAFVLLFTVPISFAQDEDVPILITELYPNPPGDELAREWVELMNVGTAVIDLSDIKIGDEESIGEKEGMLRFPKGAVLQPNEVIVIAQTAVGFRSLFGVNPDYEIQDSDPAVPDMRRYVLWALGEFALANDGDELLLVNADNRIIDSINYGDRSTFFTPTIQRPFEGQSIERVPANCDSNTASDWQTQQLPTPGQVNLDAECQFPSPIEETYLPIGAVQGDGAISLMVNEIVTIRGVVTGVYEDRNANGITFYTAFIQDEVGRADGDPDTSDGLALFLGRKRPSFNIGDLVVVSGQVTEFFGFTEIDDDHLQIEVVAEDVPLPAPIEINLPSAEDDEDAYFESLEGMRVTLPETAVVVGPTFSGCGFAVVPESVSGSRILRQSIEDNVETIIPILHESDVDCGHFPNVKQGDFVDNVVGPLIYHFDQFKVVQQGNDILQVTAVPMPSIPEPIKVEPNQFSMTTFNMENYFDSVDDTGNNAEPKPTAEELNTKQSKIAYAITHTLGCPTIIAVQEVENASLLQSLAALVATDCGFVYEVVHLESVDSRGIDLALLTNSDKVLIQEAQLRQTCSNIDTPVDDESIECAVGQSPLFSRPPLQIRLLIDDQVLFLLNNHFKSKRGGETETAPRRLAQATFVADIVDQLLTDNEAANVVVLGDFNDYELSSPLLKLTENGRLTNVLTRIPQAERYSFNFSGISQLLDGILVSSSLQERVDSVQLFHVNADFPQHLATDLSSEKMPFRATDHDLPLVIFSFTKPTPQPTVTNTAVATPQPTAQPEILAVTDEPKTPFVHQIIWVSIFMIGLGVVWWRWMGKRQKRP